MSCWELFFLRGAVSASSRESVGAFFTVAKSWPAVISKSTLHIYDIFAVRRSNPVCCERWCYDSGRSRQIQSGSSQYQRYYLDLGFWYCQTQPICTNTETVCCLVKPCVLWVVVLWKREKQTATDSAALNVEQLIQRWRLKLVWAASCCCWVFLIRRDSFGVFLGGLLVFISLLQDIFHPKWNFWSTWLLLVAKSWCFVHFH